MNLEHVLIRIADLSEDPILITEADPIDEPGPRIIYANSALFRRMGYSREEVIGRSPRLFQGKATSAAARAQLRQALMRGEPIRIEILNYDNAEEEMWCDLSITPIRDAEGRLAYFVAIQREVMPWHLREQSLIAAHKATEVASAAKTNFLAHMSHELRTPLNAIIGFSEMINQQILGPISEQRYVGYAADITSSAHHLLEIVNDVLDMSTIETGNVQLQETEFSLSELFEEVRRSLGPYTMRGDVEMLVELQAPFVLRADRRLVRQCLLNLLSNALKFTGAGGRVIISALLLADSQLALVVNDTGLGIPSTEVLEALQPYISVYRTGTRATRQGTGLGLTITKAFVELHGGTLFINSELGAGTSVFLTFPADRVMAPSEPDFDAEAWTRLYEQATSANAQSEGIENLSAQEFDSLPFGIIKLDETGRILRYNATESRYSGLLVEEVVGKNFFTEVAPCTSYSELHLRYMAGIEAGYLRETMSYVFKFPQRQMRVFIELREAKERGEGWVFVRWV